MRRESLCHYHLTGRLMEVRIVVVQEVTGLAQRRLAVVRLSTDAEVYADLVAGLDLRIHA